MMYTVSKNIEERLVGLSATVSNHEQWRRVANATRMPDSGRLQPGECGDADAQASWKSQLRQSEASGSQRSSAAENEVSRARHVVGQAGGNCRATSSAVPRRSCGLLASGLRRRAEAELKPARVAAAPARFRRVRTCRGGPCPRVPRERKRTACRRACRRRDSRIPAVASRSRAFRLCPR